MTAQFALWMKEMKDNRNLLLFLAIAVIGLDAYVLLRVDPQLTSASDGIILLCMVPFFAPIIILPFVLAHSFSSEWKADTHYLMLALPVRSFWIGLLKGLAVLAMGGLLFLLAASGIYLAYLKLAGLPKLGGVHIEATDMWVFGGLLYFPTLVLLLGIATAMEGVKLALKRWRGLAGIASVIASFYLYARLMKPARELLSFLGDFRIAVEIGGGIIKTSLMPLSWVAYTVLVGLALAALGLWLFEKRVEI